jgi:DNA-binding transcriptional regulator YiaG
MEIWKDIKDYEELYQVSNYGRVKALPKMAGNSKRNEKIKKLFNNCCGYPMVLLYKNNKKVLKSVHRLVALHFIDNPLDLPQVNHINSDRENNNSSNLEWCTSKENVNHSIRSGLRIKKLTIENVNEIRSLQNELTQKEIAIKFNMSQSMISSILSKRYWKNL